MLTHITGQVIKVNKNLRKGLGSVICKTIEGRFKIEFSPRVVFALYRDLLPQNFKILVDSQGGDPRDIDRAPEKELREMANAVMDVISGRQITITIAIE